MMKRLHRVKGNDLSCEYLSEKGQELRHDFVEGVMFQMIKERLYENP